MASRSSSITTGVLVDLAYDGTAFAGWAAQRDQRTVEDALRGAIRAIDPKADGPRGTSRTDSGVHAEQQMASFDTTMTLPARGWVRLLNRHLPDDVSVRAARHVPIGFSPRFASKKKRYRYDLLFDKVRDPLLSQRCWRIGYDMDMARMEREAMSIVGTHDFFAFRSAGDERAITLRTIYSVIVTQSKDRERVWSVTIEGSAFLYNMVRILVGTLVDVGRSQLEEGTIARAIEKRDRALAGPTAPAHGLTLIGVDLELPAEGCGERWPL